MTVVFSYCESGAFILGQDYVPEAAGIYKVMSCALWTHEWRCVIKYMESGFRNSVGKGEGRMVDQGYAAACVYVDISKCSEWHPLHNIRASSAWETSPMVS